MTRPEFLAALDRVTGPAMEPAGAPSLPAAEDLELLLAVRDAGELTTLYERARSVRAAWAGERMLLRGLVEFSSRCRNTCFYCGLNRTNKKLKRYRLSAEAILESARLIAAAGIRTIVLQSGEDGFSASWLAGVVREIKKRHGVAVTLSVGERPREDYERWREAGADRFLMRIESSDKGLYESLHSGRRIETRLRCLDDLRGLGYQVGSGVMVGIPGQTLKHLAGDIRFFRERNFDMIGIGPFIPHPDTPLRDAARGDLELTLKTVALTRIATRNAWLPATTALGSLDRDCRVDGLQAGANVVMPNFSPALYKKRYEIYPGKRCVDERAEACAARMAALAAQANLTLDYSRGDSLKMGSGGACSLYPHGV